VAFIAGKSYKVKLGTTDVSAYITNVSLSLTKDALETTTLGDGSRDYIEGLRTGSISLSGRNDFVSGAIDETLANAFLNSNLVTFKLNPTGAATSTTSAPFYTGSMWVTAYEGPAAFDGVASFSATLQVSGAITRDTSGTAF